MQRSRRERHQGTAHAAQLPPPAASSCEALVVFKGRCRQRRHEKWVLAGDHLRQEVAAVQAGVWQHSEVAMVPRRTGEANVAAPAMTCLQGVPESPSAATEKDLRVLVNKATTSQHVPNNASSRLRDDLLTLCPAL